MGGAVYYSINIAEGNHQKARQFIAASLWLLIATSIIFTLLTFFSAPTVLGLLGADGQVLAYAAQYIKIIALGTVLQLGGTGLIPFIRNFGSSNFAMIAMLGGFITNIILDFLLVWVFKQGMAGAALATIIGQGVTFFIALLYFVVKKKFHICINAGEFGSLCKAILR